MTIYPPSSFSYAEQRAYKSHSAALFLWGRCRMTQREHRVRHNTLSPGQCPSDLVARSTFTITTITQLPQELPLEAHLGVLQAQFQFSSSSPGTRIAVSHVSRSTTYLLAFKKKFGSVKSGSWKSKEDPAFTPTDTPRLDW